MAKVVFSHETLIRQKSAPAFFRVVGHLSGDLDRGDQPRGQSGALHADRSGDTPGRIVRHPLLLSTSHWHWPTDRPGRGPQGIAGTDVVLSAPASTRLLPPRNGPTRGDEVAERHHYHRLGRVRWVPRGGPDARSVTQSPVGPVVTGLGDSGFGTDLWPRPYH